MSTLTVTPEAEKREREAQLNTWARSSLNEIGEAPGEDFAIVPASDDASFRRYFRGKVSGQCYIFVDAPPEKENSEPFVRIAAMLSAAGVHAPRVFKHDFEQGFMMLSDLGETLYFDVLAAGSKAQVDGLYSDAFAAIASMQSIAPAKPLPRYDETLLRNEMSLFMEWFLPQQLELVIDPPIEKLIQSVFSKLVANALQQPVVFVHRDYHCRNLMVTPDNNPGVIDFQDAVMGPVTYDLVSLLKDCYHRFPHEDVARWVEENRLRLIDGGMGAVSSDEFMSWFEQMGMQRHLKCAGIFSRLNLRDGKARYLADIPLVVDYIVEVAARYPEFSGFADWMGSVVVPAVKRLERDS